MCRHQKLKFCKHKVAIFLATKTFLCDFFPIRFVFLFFFTNKYFFGVRRIALIIIIFFNLNFNLRKGTCFFRAFDFAQRIHFIIWKKKKKNKKSLSNYPKIPFNTTHHECFTHMNTIISCHNILPHHHPHVHQMNRDYFMIRKATTHCSRLFKTKTRQEPAKTYQ